MSAGLLKVARLGDEEDGCKGLSSEGGVVAPNEEFKVEVDFAVGTVPFESVADSEVLLKDARERRRSSLRKGIAACPERMDSSVEF